MHIVKRIVKNTAWLYGAEIISKILQVVLVLALARVYGSEIFGKFSFSITLTFLFSMFVDMGMNSLLIRELSRRKKAASLYLTNILFIKLILAVLCFGMLFLFVNLVGYPAEIRFLIYVFGLYQIFFQILEVQKSFFKSFELMHIDSLVKVLEKFLTVSLSMILILKGFSLLSISLMFLVSIILTVVISFFFLFRKISSFSHKINISFIKKFLKMSLPFAGSLILYTLYFKIDILMIDYFKGNSATGIYTSASQLIEFILFITIFSSFAVFPLLSQSFAVKNALKKRFWKVYSKMMKGLFIIGAPIVAGTLILSDRLIGILYGLEYAQAGLLLKFLILFMFLHFFTNFHNTVILSMNKERSMILLLAGVVLLNIILNYFLINGYSLVGATYAKVLSELVYFSGTLVIVRPFFNKGSLSLILKVLVASLILYALVYYIYFLNIFLILLLSVICYSLAIFFLKVVSKEDYALISELLGIHSN